MSTSYTNELGLIYIVNYSFRNYSPKNDPYKIKENLTDFKSGFFGYEKYKKHDKVVIWFIHCFTYDGAPNTKVTKLTSNNSCFTVEAEVNFGTVNLGNKDVLSTILTYIVYQTKASRYVTFLYNHSSSFGMYATDPSNSAVTDVFRSAFNKGQHTAFLTQDEQVALHVAAKQVSYDLPKLKADKIKNSAPANKERVTREEISGDFANDMLTNSELSIALQRALDLSKTKPLPKLEIIFSAGCYALNIDLAYTLKNVTHYLVGSEALMPALSYPYPDIVNMLIDELDTKKSADQIDYRTVINNTLNIFGKSYKLRNKKQRAWLQATYVSALDCTKMTNLKNAINEWILELMKSATENIDLLNAQMGYLQDLSTLYFAGESQLYDLSNFCSCIMDNSSIQEVKEASRKVLEALKEVNCFGHFFAPKVKKGDELFTGMCVYFPVKINPGELRETYKNFYSNLSPSESLFAKASFWQELINLYLKYVKLHQTPNYTPLNNNLAAKTPKPQFTNHSDRQAFL